MIELPNFDDANFITRAAPLCIFIHLKRGVAKREAQQREAQHTSETRREIQPVTMPFSLQEIEAKFNTLAMCF